MRSSQLALLLASSVLLACQSSAPLPPRNGMPAFASSVQVETTMSPTELIDAVHSALAEEGFTSLGEDLIVTEPLQVGEARARIVARITDSVVTASGSFASGTEQDTLWRVARNAPGTGEQVFLLVATIFGRLDHERVIYLFE